MTTGPCHPGLSGDAAVALALAATAVPFARSREGEAERWLRVLRLYGDAGTALQALGVGEGPLESHAEQRAVQLLPNRPLGEDAVELVADRARELAAEKRASCVCTLDLLFAVIELYDTAFARALYARGTTCQELLDHLAAQAAARR